MKLLITGANGFIGKNLLLHLERQYQDVEFLRFTRDTPVEDLAQMVEQCHAIVHLAGVNRPIEELDFEIDNVDLSAALCAQISKTGRSIPLLFTSSIHAVRHSSYGKSKKAAEKHFEWLGHQSKSPITILRLPGVFGKWCRPNYNSVVSTFCHNIAHDQDVTVNDSDTVIDLVYIDDLVAFVVEWLEHIRAKKTLHPGVFRPEIQPVYRTRLGSLVEQIRTFHQIPKTLQIQTVGQGFLRALYATYISYLPKEKFSYKIPQIADNRGRFVEIFKTAFSGQISFSSLPPGAVRGQHFHHTKTEKFLVVSGQAQFGFRSLNTGQKHIVRVSADQPEIVETIPGWAHNIENTGDTELAVLIWANEVFDKDRPDTYAEAV